MNVLGNGTSGGGYAPLGMFGNVTLSEYGPLSATRAVAAPVVTYTRGYDGVPRATVGTVLTYPNMPAIAPVVYPTRANYARGLGLPRTPPAWDSALNWIDQD
jgi:hypothetical protein